MTSASESAVTALFQAAPRPSTQPGKLLARGARAGEAAQLATTSPRPQLASAAATAPRMFAAMLRGLPTRQPQLEVPTQTSC